MLPPKRRFAPFTVAAAFASVLSLSPALAQSAGSLDGSITSDDGSAIAGAVVTVHGEAGDRSAVTSSDGRFAIAGLPAGVYAIGVRAAGYGALTGRTVGVRAGRSDLTLALTRSASTLITIGRTQAAAGATLSTSTVPTTTIATQTYAEQGYTRVSDVLQNDISTTLIHPLGGGSTSLPTSVALRGPDPTETLVDIDGHQVNSGNTGDFDLSLLDPEDLANIELIKGISPSSLIAPDTIDGAINIRTLEPTVRPHSLVRFSAGSFNSFNESALSTGTFDRLGYAFTLHRTTTAGEVNQPIVDASTGAPATVGSALDSSTMLAKLRYSFGHSRDAYAEFSFRDQTQVCDLSAALSFVPSPDASAGEALAGNALSSAAGTTLLAHSAGYGVDLSVPFGSPGANGIRAYDALYRHSTSYTSQSVSGPGADSSPYLYNDRDLIDDETVQINRDFARGSLTLRYDVLNERLATDFLTGVVNAESVARGSERIASAKAFDATAGGTDGGAATLGLGQTQRFLALRGTFDPTSKLHLTAAGYYSRYSIFGSSLDPRFGASFTPDARSVVRFSVGTTYQPPNLQEVLTSPPSELVGQVVTQGNPNLKPDHATEYGLGFEHLFELGARRTSVSVDVYRVNLRTPATPTLAVVTDAQCGPSDAGGDGVPCPIATTVNAGGAIYQGLEIQSERALLPFTTVRAGYAVRSAYLTSVPPNVQDGTLVVGEQTRGLPLQKATLSIAHAPPLGFTAGAGLVYEGLYNELDRPQFALLNASLGVRTKAFELTLAGTNLTNVYDARFTQQGAGATYGQIGAPAATDALALQGTALNLSLTHRF